MIVFYIFSSIFCSVYGGIMFLQLRFTCYQPAREGKWNIGPEAIRPPNKTICIYIYKSLIFFFFRLAELAMKNLISFYFHNLNAANFNVKCNAARLSVPLCCSILFKIFIEAIATNKSFTNNITFALIEI